MSMSTDSEKQFEVLHTLIMNPGNLPPSHPECGRSYLDTWMVGEYLDCLPKIKEDGSNYILWKDKFDAGRAYFPYFSLLDRDPHGEEDEQVLLAIAAALEVMLSEKIANFLEDSDFADSIYHLSCKEQLERINDRYTTSEFDQISNALIEGFIASQTTRSNNSTKKLYAERTNSVLSLACNPKIAVSVLLFSEFLYYYEADGTLPYSTRQFFNVLVEEVINSPSAAEITMKESFERLGKLIKDFSKKSEIFTHGHKLIYRSEMDINAVRDLARVVPSEITDPEFTRFAKAFYSKKGEYFVKNVNVSKKTLFKQFFLPRLCPFCLRDGCDFATHKCLK